MTKYELAVVVSAKLEEEDRAAVVEKAKDSVARSQMWMTGARRDLLMKFRR